MEGNVGSGADGPERTLDMTFVQKGDVIEAGGQDRWAERAALGL